VPASCLVLSGYDFCLSFPLFLLRIFIAGLLNAENHEFVVELVAMAQAEFNAAIAAPDRHKARMLLRLFTALVVANVLHPSSVVAALQQVMDTAIAVAESGAALSTLLLGRRAMFLWCFACCAPRAEDIHSASQALSCSVHAMRSSMPGGL